TTRLGPAGLVAEVAGHAGAGDDGAERPVGGGSGQCGTGGGEVGDDVGVFVGPGQYPGYAGLDADERATWATTVGGAAVPGEGVAGTGVGERERAAARRCVGDDPAEGVVGVGLGALGDALPERVVACRDGGAAGDDGREGASCRVRVDGPCPGEQLV